MPYIKILLAALIFYLGTECHPCREKKFGPRFLFENEGYGMRKYKFGYCILFNFSYRILSNHIRNVKLLLDSSCATMSFRNEGEFPGLYFSNSPALGTFPSLIY